MTCTILFFLGSLNVDGLKDLDWDQLFSLPKHYWEDDIAESMRFLDQQTGEDLPKKIREQLESLQKRIQSELFN